MEKGNLKVKEGHCECVKGLAVCHHMIALLLCAHYNVSSTDVACRWNKPAERLDRNTGESIEEIFPHTKPQYSALNGPPTDADLQAFYRTGGMCGEGACGAMWLFSPEVEESVTNTSVSIPCIKDILKSPSFQNSDNKEQYLKSRLTLKWEDIMKIAIDTCGQGSNPNWLRARLCRITASNFGDVIKACSRKPSASLLSKLTEGRNLDGIHSIRWGKDNESVAIACFEKETNLKVVPTGIWLAECGVVGASPDGLIEEDGVVEVKCPFSYRNAKSLKEELNNRKDYILSYNGGMWSINKSHSYYHQIQGQIHITKRKYCFLVLWIPSDIVIFKVLKDVSWSTNITKLETFFYDYLYPNLLQKA